MKRSKKYHKQKKFYLCIISKISTYGRLPNEKEFGGTKQMMNYYVKQLKERNIITNPSYAIWELNKENWVTFDFERSKKNTTCYTKKSAQKINKTQRAIRLHSLQFVAQLPNFDYWHRRTTYLTKRNIPFTSIFHGKKQRVVHNGVIFHLCSDSIVFYCPENINIYGDTVRIAEARGIAWARTCLSFFSFYLGIDLSINGDYVFSISRSHVAETKNELAKDSSDRNEKLRISENGKVWAEVDKSLRSNEFEFLDGKRSISDADNLVDAFNTLRNNPMLLTELANQINSLVSISQKQNEAINNLVKENNSFDSFKY